jgi:uncharacterized membrane protein YraQ (UPF0718 family)
MLMQLINNFWDLFVLSAPWLMLGLLLAGIINVYLPKEFLNKHLGSDGLYTTIKAAIIGAPMPLCSCGVIPAALGLRRSGASKSATTAFLVSTPETGVDSISVSYVLLGPFMAIIRPIAAITSAIVAGVLVGRDKEDDTVNGQNKAQIKDKTSTDNKDKSNEPSCLDSKQVKATQQSSCCATDSEVKQSSYVDEKKEQTNCCPKPTADITTSSCSSVKSRAEVEHSCCGNKSTKALEQQEKSFLGKLKQAIAFSCTKLLSDTAIWLLIGLGFAAIVQTYVPLSFFSQWGSGILAMVMVILISIPMYVCATASTPIAAGLLLSGVSPGAVLVFMLAGPATNIATLGVVASELGKRAVVSYLTGVIGVAIIFGFITDFLVEHYKIEVAPMLAEHHEVLPYWLSQAFAFILVILLIRLMLLKLKTKRQALTS